MLAARGILKVLGFGLILALLLAVAFPESMLQALGDFLVIRDPVEPVDAVIAISGDGTGERARTAAALVRQGYGRWLMLSGSGRRPGAPPGNATAAMVRDALEAGIPRDRMLIDDQSWSTIDNARNSARLMQARHLTRAIVVTSPYHTRRAAWAFRSVFLPRGLDVRVVAAQNSFFDVRQWWTREDSRWFVIREYAKLLGFVMGLR